MIEVSADSGDVVNVQLLEDEELRDNVIHLREEKLSSIDYKTQALFTLFLSELGISDFYAGNHLMGLAKLATTIVVGSFTQIIAPIIATISLFELSSGQYRDSEGNVIRQVTLLKKEEMSAVDQKTALLLASFLGVLGAHQFYAGKPLEGVLMLCTLGGLGIWSMVNIYQLATCGFKDGEGKTVCPDYIKYPDKVNADIWGIFSA